MLILLERTRDRWRGKSRAEIFLMLFVLLIFYLLYKRYSREFLTRFSIIIFTAKKLSECCPASAKFSKSFLFLKKKAHNLFAMHLCTLKFPPAKDGKILAKFTPFLKILEKMVCRLCRSKIENDGLIHSSLCGMYEFSFQCSITKWSVSF